MYTKKECKIYWIWQGLTSPTHEWGEHIHDVCVCLGIIITIAQNKRRITLIALAYQITMRMLHVLC